MRKGQSLIEVFIALGIGTMVAGGIAGAFVISVRSNELGTKSRNATIVNDSLIDLARTYIDGNWSGPSGLSGLSTGPSNTYKLVNSGGTWVVQAGTESVVISGITYNRSFYFEPVSRTGGNIDAVYSAPGNDLSTRKVTVQTAFPVVGQPRSISNSFYSTRWRTITVRQTDWSGGSGQAGPMTNTNAMFSSAVNVDGTTTAGSLLPTLSTCSAVSEQCAVVSSIYDTGLTGGAGFNYFMWQGDQPTWAKVQFKLAVSNNPAGPWSFGTAIAPIGPNMQALIPQEIYNNARYFQYKIIFDTLSATPKVDDVIIGLSR